MDEHAIDLEHLEQRGQFLGTASRVQKYDNRLLVLEEGVEQCFLLFRVSAERVLLFQLFLRVQLERAEVDERGLASEFEHFIQLLDLIFYLEALLLLALLHLDPFERESG